MIEKFLKKIWIVKISDKGNPLDTTRHRVAYTSNKYKYYQFLYFIKKTLQTDLKKISIKYLKKHSMILRYSPAQTIIIRV